MLDSADVFRGTSTQGEKQSFITTPISTPIQTQTIPPSPAQLPDYYAYCRNTYPGTTYNPSTNHCEYPTIAPVITTTTTSTSTISNTYNFCQLFGGSYNPSTNQCVAEAVTSVITTSPTLFYAVTPTPVFTPIQTPIITISPTNTPDYYAYCRNTYPGTTYNPSTNQCEYPTIAPVITTTTTPIYTPVQTLGITNSCIFWITSNPIGASIYLDNQYEGITNSSYTEIFATRTTQHSLVLMKQGYANYTLIGTSCITGNIQLYSGPDSFVNNMIRFRGHGRRLALSTRLFVILGENSTKN